MTAAPRPTGQSSAKPRPTRTSAEAFALAGPSDPPDPEFNAYRRDLADIALAAHVIASHYAVPVERRVLTGTALRSGPSDDAQPIGRVEVGEPFLMLEDSMGWVWGYAGDERRVGYVRSDALGT